MATSEETLQLLIQQNQALAQSVAHLTKQVSSLTSEMTGPTVVPLRGGSFEDSDEFWVRLKPYNERPERRLKKQGHRVMTARIRNIPILFRGGTGQPGSVPTWYKVDRKTAELLSTYKQDHRHPENSPDLFDIVTEAERLQIDSAENSQRLSSLGQAGLPPAQMAKMLGDIKAKTATNLVPGRKRAENAPARKAPSMVSGAAAFQRAPVEDITPTAPVTKTLAPPPEAVAASVLPPPPPEMSNAESLPEARADAMEGLADEYPGDAEETAMVDGSGTIESEPVSDAPPAPEAVRSTRLMNTDRVTESGKVVEDMASKAAKLNSGEKSVFARAESLMEKAQRELANSGSRRRRGAR